jgi:hypothetical protein
VQTPPLIFRDGHLFVKIERSLWLLDTGAPTSFGNTGSITIAGKQFAIVESYMGLSSETLSEFVGVPCIGLLGADVLGHFDHVFDCTNEKLTVSSGELTHSGQTLQLSEFGGIPILTARISDSEYRMFFDTGAQISYFQDDALTDFPAGESITDFYPGFGRFQTETYQVDISLGGVDFTIRCGSLPGLLGMTLEMADTQGIIGNQIMSNRVVGISRGGMYCACEPHSAFFMGRGLRPCLRAFLRRACPPLPSRKN